MTGARFDGALKASLLQIGGALFMGSLAQNTTSFEDVDLSGAKIGQEVRMRGARFGGALNAACGSTMRVSLPVPRPIVRNNGPLGSSAGPRRRDRAANRAHMGLRLG
jgi:hypothetical protein